MERRAYLWYKGTATDLNTVIDLNSGWQLQRAEGINNVGEIVGSGEINGETHAFLLTPVPPVPGPPPGCCLACLPWTWRRA